MRDVTCPNEKKRNQRVCRVFNQFKTKLISLMTPIVENWIDFPSHLYATK